MNTVQYEPWNLMNRWHRDFDPMVGQFLGGSEPVLGNNAAWAPSVDVHEANDRFVVQADLPGVEAKEIEVSAEQGVLTIRGERRTEHRSEGYQRTERVEGTFMRRFTLPQTAQADAIKARYVNGVLEVAIPKQKKAETTRIAVEVIN